MNYSEWRLNFFRSLTVLLSAGIPLHVSLGFIEEQQQPQDAAVLSEMSEMILSGYRFSQALAAQTDRFDPFHINSIRIAEESGSLVRTIAELEVCEQKREEHRKLLKGKLTYPAILAVVCLLVVVVLPVFCLDGLLGIIEQNTDTVPFLTQALLAVNNFLGQPLLWLVLTGIMIIVSTKRNHLARAIRERHILWNLLPLFGPLNRLRHLSSALVFSNSLALQLEVGLTPLNALPLAAGTTGDPAWEKLGLSARDRLVEGETFSDAFGKPEFLDPIFVSILAVGQESGKLPRLLKSYVKMCQEELEYLSLIHISEPTRPY